jgi:hypothetical protein
MRRRDLIKLAGAPFAMASVGSVQSGVRNSAETTAASQLLPTIELYNSQFRLTLSPGLGLNCDLVHSPSNTLLAEGAYSYSFGIPAFRNVSRSGDSVILSGLIDSNLAIEQRFTVPESGAWIEESTKLTNIGLQPRVQLMRSGWVLPVQEDTLKGYTFTAVPLRLDLDAASADAATDSAEALKDIRARDRYFEFSLDDILYRRRAYFNCIPRHRAQQTLSAGTTFRQFSETHSAEAWVLGEGQRGFVISKHNPTQPEYAVLDRVYLPKGSVGLRWGGSSAMNEFEELHLAPGATYEFGTTRLAAFQGDRIQGCYVFREEMESRGYRTPINFDPPLHWNELYDNMLCCAGDANNHIDPKNRDKFYRIADMRLAAAKAQVMGCEALYLDPGWDTPQSSKLWAEKRLGKLQAFVAMLKNEYGALKLGLHTPLSWWTGSGCDLIPGSALVDAFGVETEYACGASQQYVMESARRLRALADAEAHFFMFDGAAFRTACWSADHGHAVPSTVEEHIQATNQLARLVHQTHPGVLIEVHDQGTLSSPPLPMYLGQSADSNGTRGFDERWGFEYMWNPMQDLMSGNSFNLYYYALAYSLPLYLHIDLRTDNRNAIVFWWTASTCRHLGVGGTHADPEVIAAQKQAIQDYKRLKSYFTKGVFFGLGEMTHVHSSHDGMSAIINCFNLESHLVERDIRFAPAELHLNPRKEYRFAGARFERKGTDYVYVGRVSIPAQGHALIEVT